MATKRGRGFLRTARRQFRIPPCGAVFSIDEIPLVIDVPPEVVRRAVMRGTLRTFLVDDVRLVDGADLTAFVAELDAVIAEAHSRKSEDDPPLDPKIPEAA